MSKRAGEGVSSAVRSGIGVRGAAGSEDDRVEPFRFAARFVLEIHYEIRALFTDADGLRTEPEVNSGKQALENGHHVGTLVGNGKRAEVVLDFQRTAV